jgi:hypothetical protein
LILRVHPIRVHVINDENICFPLFQKNVPYRVFYLHLARIQPFPDTNIIVCEKFLQNQRRMTLARAIRTRDPQRLVSTL